MTEGGSLAFNTVFLAKSVLIDSKITRMSRWGKKFYTMGLVQGMEGNLSYRTQLGFIISGTGVELDKISPETVVEVTGLVYGLNKTSVYVKGTIFPSRETILHSQIYEELPSINAIFHVHDNWVVENARKLHIPVTSVEKEAGSQKLAQEALSLLKFKRDLRYFVLKNHGIIALGTTMDEAGKLVVDISKKAKGKNE